ncbi:putative spectrin beta chain non-erythrocytic 4-like [Scophthalmus maximus]|uniref:Putative spectrin beta chain non-erythrocytic 4-like n=1 Tax=Scophthalmus maximus TaxID=52904 RepID=A0A2U9B9A3_SCOMX|nr:putative spectrin beta chain non-erythrocytic 4-like [Scophthalmus maximus]
MLMARDTARDEAQKLHRKWLKHQAFMAELARNKEWLAKIEQEGQELIQEKPELRSVVQQKMVEIRECWSDLESTTKAKARQLFENNKPEPAMKSYSDLDNQLSHLEQQPPQLEQAHHLPTFNEQLQKFQAMESQIGDFYKDVGELGSLQGVCLPQRGLMAGDKEGGEQSGMVETRIVRLIEPLKERRRILLASKEMHQVAQDLEDELLWIQERLPLASCKDYGNNLQSVQQHVKKNQTLQRELTGRRARVEEVLDRAGIIASLRTPEVEFVREGAGHVRQLWEVLQLETERRSVMLDAVLQAQQYYSEAAKVESWLSGQKLHLVSEEKGTDEPSTLQLLKDHLALEQTVETYAETVGMLSQQCQHLLELGHPESEQITKQQSHIDRLYVSLKDMVEHRKTKLEQQYWLYQLNKEVEELEKWITERESVASSTELGQDLEDVTVLQERFTKFASETNNIGQQRMEQVNKMVNEMIDCGHSDAATIAEWKDSLNESWADLLELMETRRQMLAASHQLHKFFTDCKEVLAQIAGKMKQLPEVRACQANITNPATLQRLMHSFEHALQLLVAQVRQLQENAAQLRTIYAGEKAEAIMVKEQEVMEAWKELLSSCEASRVQVTSVTDKVQFFSVVRENLMWMEGIMGQIGWDEPRDLTALEVMIKQHQELKAKIDGRSKTILQCADLGKILIAAGNPASEEIKEKLDSLLSKQKDLVEKWDKHQEKIQRKQEQFQFAQETVRAEAWLKAKEPLITSKGPEGGEAQAQTDEAEQLILRHEAFRKAAVTWKERFSSLRQLSAVSLTPNMGSRPINRVVANMGSSGYLAQNYPSSGGLGSSGLLAQNHYSSGSLGSSGYLAQSGGIMDPKMAYAWQHLKADFMQPRINHIHKAVNPLLEASRVQREQFGDIPMADMMGPESGLELLHGRLQRDPRGSRSDPQMDHLRREREYKLGRQTSSEQEIQARLNELPMIVRQERYRRRLERQSSSEQEGNGKQRIQRQDSSDLEGSIKEGSEKRSGEKRSTMAEIVEQVQEREAANARGEPYRPPSSLSAPVTRFDGRPRARDRPKPRRRPRPKEPEETRRSRSAPATGAPTTPQPPSHTAHNEGSLYRKKATSSDLEAQQRSPNSKSWVNVYCVLKEGKLTFYKDARNHNTTYNGEPPVNLSNCSFDSSMGYKKKKNVFILQVNDGNNFVFHAKDEEDLKAWISNIATCIAEHEDMAKWDKPGTSSMDPDRSERKERSEGDADARSERSELAEGEERSEKERSEKGDGSEKLDTSEIADKMEGGAGGSSTSGKSK